MSNTFSFFRKKILASRSRSSLLGKLIKYWNIHFQSSSASLKNLFKTFPVSIVTVGIIGIILSLPLGLGLILQNGRTLGVTLDKEMGLSLYLKSNLSTPEQQELLSLIQKKVGVASAKLISPEEAVHFFENESKIKDFLKLLSINPFPPVIEVLPGPDYRNIDSITQLENEFRALSGIETIQTDIEWVKKFQSLLNISKNVTYFLMIFLIVAVLLISAHSIRLLIRQKQEEIIVIDLIGGGKSFIRRPFLYLGFNYGLLGGILSLCIVYFMTLVMQAPLKELFRLYEISFRIQTFSYLHIFYVLLSSGFLGLVGAWTAFNSEFAYIKTLE